MGLTQKLVLDDWQREVLNTKGNICLCSGRQVGKSTVISMDAGEYALNNPGKEIMIISATERQALLLFEKVLAYIFEKKRSMIMTGKDKPTKHELKLKNGSIIRCLPTGLTGYGIRGFTIHRLYADEAAFIPEDVWAAVTPMLTTTGGDIVLLSTPLGSEGYFYRAFHDKKFTSFQISTEEVAESREEPQRTRMLEFLKDERERMTKLQYQQEYQGRFVGALKQFFPDELIKQCMKGTRPDSIATHQPHFAGVDVGGLGSDETAISIFKQSQSKRMIQVECLTEENNLTTMTTRQIITLEMQYRFKRIGVDDGGIGYGVWSELIEERRTRRKTIALNNSSRRTDHTGEKSKKLLKEEMYHELKRQMEKGMVTLLDDPEVYRSFKSVQAEYQERRYVISGNNTHIVEASMRAVWCSKSKGLKLWVHYV